jgi:hypothetical protein
MGSLGQVASRDFPIGSFQRIRNDLKEFSLFPMDVLAVLGR